MIQSKITSPAQIVLLYTTINSLEEAEKLAQGALEERLAACINIIPGGNSLYIWEQRIERSSECYLLFKTTSALSDVLQEWIVQHHPYTTPAILIWNAATSPTFANYIQCSLY